MRVANECAQNGVLVYPVQGAADGTLGDHILIAPPAIITAEQIAASVNVIRDSLTVVTESIPKSQIADRP